MTEMIELGSFAYIDAVVASVSQQFPKRCNCCEVEFKDFAEFIEKTYIPKHNESRNIQIIQCEDGNVEDGYILAYRNCTCHSTITILCALEDELKAKLSTLYNASVPTSINMTRKSCLDFPASGDFSIVYPLLTLS